MATSSTWRVVLGCSVLLSLAPASPADVRLPAIISDHMVLQQDAPARIWGWAEPGEGVTVSLSSDSTRYSTKADPDGEWSVMLDLPKAESGRGVRGADPFTITIRGENEIVIHDVLIGEVWVASGQSNMEMSLASTIAGVEGGRSEIAQADYPQIRFFQVRRAVSATPMKDCVGEWKVCSPETIGRFSAAAYYFAQRIHSSQGVPVGLIGTYWGGTVAEAWTSAEGLVGFPEFREDLAIASGLARDPAFVTKRYQTALDGWKQRLASADAGSRDVAFAQADLDDSSWRSVGLPGVWEKESGFEGFDGFVWYRREFDAPVGSQGEPLRLTLGPIDDMDSVWINGEIVGQTLEPGRWQQPRDYTVPGGLMRASGNAIAIRVLDTGGAGGLTGSPEQMAISAIDTSGASVPLAGDWRVMRGAALREIPPMPRRPTLYQNSPTALSNAMIEPITPYSIRGAIWYQGESNRTRARQYRELFPAMIRDWRRRWDNDFPFYYVQIAPFAYGGDTGQAAELREAQMMAMQSLDNVGMAVTMDIGNPSNIHPKKKKQVGERLARWALNKVYNTGVDDSGPVATGVEFGDGIATITFEHGTGLDLRGEDAERLFELAGKDGEYVRAESVEVVGAGIVVRSGQVGKVRSVRYAWGAADAGVLFNGAGMAASSFRWPIP